MTTVTEAVKDTEQFWKIAFDEQDKDTRATNTRREYTDTCDDKGHSLKDEPHSFVGLPFHLREHRRGSIHTERCHDSGRNH